MTTMSHPGVTGRRALRSVTASVVTAFTVLTSLAVRLVSPHKAAFANLRSVPLTVAGIGCIDYAAFHLGDGWGWLVTGVSLMVLEHMIADDVQ